jgi:hypothetical protein
MEKVFVVKRVAEKLWATENAIDQALGQASTLMADLVTARQELNLAANVGNEAVGKIVAAMAALAEARQAALDAHIALDATRIQIGVRKLETRMDKPFQIETAEPREERRAS